jgi:chorismate mutase
MDSLFNDICVLVTAAFVLTFVPGLRLRERSLLSMRDRGTALFSLDANAGTQEQLEACRQQIDSLDQRIVELVQQRARVVEEVGNIKREAHLPVTVPSREQQVIAKAQELAKGGPMPAEAVGRIYEKLVEEMRNWEAKLGAATP